MSKSLPNILRLLTVAFVLYSCSAEKHESNCLGCGENGLYGDLLEENLPVDIVPVSEKDTTLSADENFAENKKKIEKIYGEQWDFCHCILANDSLDKVVKSGAELDDNFMKVFETVDQKCKAFLVMSPNQTPEERAAHEKKTRNCLRNAR
ncbi:hypothetical protein N9F27_00170 [Crocinitomicaceae bacterium]|nr:hypothetical protein [Crocinitomicaceae bacterium]